MIIAGIADGLSIFVFYAVAFLIAGRTDQLIRLKIFVAFRILACQ